MLDKKKAFSNPSPRVGDSPLKTKQRAVRAPPPSVRRLPAVSFDPSPTSTVEPADQVPAVTQTQDDGANDENLPNHQPRSSTPATSTASSFAVASAGAPTNNSLVPQPNNPTTNKKQRNRKSPPTKRIGMHALTISSQNGLERRSLKWWSSSI